MKENAVVAILCLTFALVPPSMKGFPKSQRSDSRDPLALTYVSNAGVVVTIGDFKVLIDALFDKPHPDYHAPNPHVLEQIFKGEAGFEGINLLLVTHNHPDHFDAQLAVRFLETFPEPMLCAPRDAVEEMRKVATDWTRIGQRVIPLEIQIGRQQKMDLAGVSVTAFRTLHSGNRESPMNIMYLLEKGGRRIFHEGDSRGIPEDYRDFDLGKYRIDLSLVHFWFPLDPDCARFMQDVLKSDHIALTHLPIRLEDDAPSKIDQVKSF